MLVSRRIQPRGYSLNACGVARLSVLLSAQDELTTVATICTAYLGAMLLTASVVALVAGMLLLAQYPSYIDTTTSFVFETQPSPTQLVRWEDADEASMMRQ